MTEDDCFFRSDSCSEPPEDFEAHRNAAFHTSVERSVPVVDCSPSAPFAVQFPLVLVAHVHAKAIRMSWGTGWQLEDIDLGFAKLDVDSSGHIDFDEFYTWYKDVAGCAGKSNA